MPQEKALIEKGGELGWKMTSSSGKKSTKQEEGRRAVRKRQGTIAIHLQTEKDQTGEGKRKKKETKKPVNPVGGILKRKVPGPRNRRVRGGRRLGLSLHDG